MLSMPKKAHPLVLSVCFCLAVFSKSGCLLYGRWLDEKQKKVLPKGWSQINGSGMSVKSGVERFGYKRRMSYFGLRKSALKCHMLRV